MRFDLRLYLVLDPDMTGGHEQALAVTEAALQGGISMLQLRAPTWKKGPLLALAEALLAHTRAAGVPLLINDHVDVALASGADGVHLGQADLPLAAARRLLGPQAIIGLSISQAGHLAGADAALADYYGIGPVYPTTTKPDADPVLGLDALHALAQQGGKPCVAIGGITLANAASVMASSVDGIAVVSAICAADDPRAAAAALRLMVKGNSR